MISFKEHVFKIFSEKKKHTFQQMVHKPTHGWFSLVNRKHICKCSVCSVYRIDFYKKLASTCSRLQHVRIALIDKKLTEHARWISRLNHGTPHTLEKGYALKTPYNFLPEYNLKCYESTVQQTDGNLCASKNNTLSKLARNPLSLLVNGRQPRLTSKTRYKYDTP